MVWQNIVEIEEMKGRKGVWFMEEIDKINNQVLTEIRDITPNDASKEIILNFQNELTNKDILLLSSINRLKNPFRMIGVENVMKDLNICRGVAYKIFQREDFPSINVGKNKQIMLVSYILWKMTRKEW